MTLGRQLINRLYHFSDCIAAPKTATGCLLSTSISANYFKFAMNQSPNSTLQINPVSQQSYGFSTSVSDGPAGHVIALPFKAIPIPPAAAIEQARLFEELQRPVSPGEKKKQPPKAKHSVFKLANSQIQVHGWKFNDWDYKKQTVPTHARGLFSVMNNTGGDSRMEIVSRGYDKFYNIGETSETKWSWIEENTQSPYYLTQKENGCIIFLSGLPDGNLLVCSKRSAGVSVNARGRSHAQAGEDWVEKHLATVGHSKRDLAATLRSLNATAVAELCDDSFEEHILEYPTDKAGLYLHGLNLNTPDFHTYPFEAVVQFAEIFGMNPTRYTKVEDVKELREFLESCAESGAWGGIDIEGFVVRCQAQRQGALGPSDFFFKYKFEEPYLLYRLWREVTKSMLSGQQIKLNKHKKITREYLQFAKSYFKGREDLVSQYMANRGIIAVRDAFLQHHGKKGADIIREEAAESDDEITVENEDSDSEITVKLNSMQVGLSNKDYKYVIVPVATVGCGKTTIAVALSELLGWGHVQNDNIPRTKKGGTGRKLCEEVKNSLASRPVSIIDRNSHQRRERAQIQLDMNDLMPIDDLRFVALHFIHGDKSRRQEIRQITLERIMKRGDNHQTVKAASYPQKKTAGIIDGFIYRFEPVDMTALPDKSMFDLVIDLQIDEPPEVNIKLIISKFMKKYPGIVSEMPTDDAIREAARRALAYVPEKSGV